MIVSMWRSRAGAAGVALVFLGVAFGIRLLAGDGILDGSGALAQNSGTALYASMIYAILFALTPQARPLTAGVAAITFCWAVELFQLTGVPALLAEHSVVARLVLGAHFDGWDMLWYPVGVLPLVALHQLLLTRSTRRPAP
ncbi:ribosomal maturation YjgA family protein [Actinoplanes missouriensis]|uniref:ribosomal maturation YjgA family protein n=1 Tax=Actinoplanes missouriensis TaxID=1866 RepID=UPI00368B5FBF